MNNETNQIEDMSESSKDELVNSQTSLANSWVLVDLKPEELKPGEELNPDKKKDTDSVNTFYLNCSEEPIQELTEHELGSHNSGSDSDTDGISVISDSDPFKTDEEEHESPLDETKNEETTLFEDVSLLSTDSTTVKTVTTSNQISYIIAFALVLLLIPLHWYLTPNVTQEEIDTPNEMLAALKKGTGKNQQWDDDLNDFSSEHIMIDDPLSYCTKIHETTDYLYRDRNIKKCIKRIDKAKQKLKKINYNLQNKASKADGFIKDDDIEEIELDYKAQYSKIDNKENKHEIYKKKIKYRTSDNKKDNSYEKEYKIEENTSDEKSKAYKVEYGSRALPENETWLNYAVKENNETQNNKHITNESENLRYKKYLEIENRLQAKEKYLKEKEEYLQRKENELRQKELENNIKSDRTKMNVNHSEKKNETSSEISNDSDESSVESSEESRDDSPNEDSNSYKHRVKKEKKHSRINSSNNEKQKDKKYKKSKDRDTQNHENDNDKDGEWYTEMFEGRSKIRKNTKKEKSFIHDSKERISRDRKDKNSGDEETFQNDEVTKNGQWYSRLFEARSKMRRLINKNKYKFFDYVDNSDFMRKPNVYSSRTRGNSVYF